jgi:hypothetical protein
MNSTITVPTAPDKAGYTFTGWKEVNGTAVIPIGVTSYLISKTIFFKAQYISDADMVHTAIFLDDDNNKIAILKAAQSSHITTPTAPPTKAQHTFKGWQEVGKSGTIAAGASYTLTKNAFFKAKYELDTGRYKVSFYDAALKLLSSDIITVGSGINLNTKASALGVANWYKAKETSPTVGTFTPDSSINFYAAANVIEISDQAGLSDIRNNLSGKYILINDIVLESSGAGFDANGWRPIGHHAAHIYDNPSTPFEGIFNGNGYAISNLQIDRPSTNYIGIFGYAKGAAITNLGILSSEIKGNQHVGSIAGMFESSTIANSYSAGSVNADGMNVGGIVGYTDKSTITDIYFIGGVKGFSGIGGVTGYAGSSAITNSYSTGSISGTFNIGGIIGDISGSTVTNSYSQASVSGDDNIGGIAGWIYVGNIAGSYSAGSVSGVDRVGGIAGDAANINITNSYSTGNIIGTNYIGGIAGESSNSKIDNSYSEASVSGVDSIGGIAGLVHSSTISNSYFTGSTNGDKHIGGIAGYINLHAVITNNYATGNVKGSSDVGGIVGAIGESYEESLIPKIDSTITNNAAINQAVQGTFNVNRVLGYLLSDNGEVKNNFARAIGGRFSDPNKVVNAGIGKADSDFKTQSTYSNNLGWKFGNNDANPWKINASKNNGYPYLYWQE